ncbi:hypothetical protein VIGAN_03221900 [Vigna angularis var. angularis]|uniref:Uncharacterized protein n=1 Tax=Vigna angularis var. angularis TaxID=157739 RepID=A0A0S3RNS5_PHAAN|nr:hypothetical protein VIGAN_03221900 [Vigna angularis var. angularis]
MDMELVTLLSNLSVSFSRVESYGHTTNTLFLLFRKTCWALLPSPPQMFPTPSHYFFIPKIPYTSPIILLQRA